MVLNRGRRPGTTHEIERITYDPSSPTYDTCAQTGARPEMEGGSIRGVPHAPPVAPVRRTTMYTHTKPKGNMQAPCVK